MTRDQAVRIAVTALALWHEQEHGDGCVCEEGEMFGRQASAVIDALVSEGAAFPLVDDSI